MLRFEFANTIRLKLAAFGVATGMVTSAGCTASDRPDTVQTSGGSGPVNVTGSSGNGCSGSAGAAGTKAYPEGPYATGNPAVCSTIENLQFQGFVNDTGESVSTELPFSKYSMAELRDGEARYALLLIAAVWCTSCQSTAQVLQRRGPEVLAAGGLVVQLLVEGRSSGAAPTEQELAAWVDTYALPVTIVGPVDGRAREVFPSREYGYVIDLDTMQVLWRAEALYENPTLADIGADAILDGYLGG